MAKTGFWLRGAKGKLAGTTMYKDSTTGETIMREIVTPSNPKTESQLVQRIIMATIGSAYSLSKSITDHSFEGMKAGRETMSYFIRQNVNFCREKVAAMLAEGLTYDDIYNFIKLGQKGFVPNQYQLSMGSLPQVETSIARVSIGGVERRREGLVQVIKTNTYQGVIDALGVKRGDQLTFISVEQVSVADSEFQFCRVILDPTDPQTKDSLPLSTPFVGDNGVINAPSVRNEGNFKFNVDATTGLTFYPSRLRLQAGVSGCAVIVSRKVGDVWNRSTSYLAYEEGEGYSLGEALEAAKNGSTVDLYTPNALYLNNAGQGGGVAAQSGADSGEGGSGEPEAQVLNAAVDNIAVVQGTKKNIVLPSDATFPHAATITIAANAAANDLEVEIVAQNGTEIATGIVEDGAATLSGNFAQNTDYEVKLAGGSTGYKFFFTLAGSSDE